MPEPYPPIGDYALLADCHSAALVSRDGSVDWACLTRFDRSSCFGRILDWERGGHFAITPRGATACARAYRRDSLVLETTFTTAGGRARLIDAFAMRRGGQRHPRHQLLRIVEGVEGRVEFDVELVPRFDYGELRPWIRFHPFARSWTVVGGHSALRVTTPVALEHDEDACALRGRLTVQASERLPFSVIATTPFDSDVTAEPFYTILEHLDETLGWWDQWAAGLTDAGGRWAPAVRRSAVVLKGLTHATTGAVVAAPTTSLPEEIGGERNWDYRYSWIRDSALVLAALCVVGHDEVARGFRLFVMRSAAGRAEDLQILYGIDGRRHLPEVILDLEGYRGSGPVRIGNAAARQVQNDVYGHLLEAAHLWRRTHEEMEPDEWRFLRQVVDRAATVWREPDRGIWEIRGEPRHFTHSKAMLWVAMDRGVQLAREVDDGSVDVAAWEVVRDAIRDEVEVHGVRPDPVTGAPRFVQAYGSDELDAALLVLPALGFCEPDDPRFVATVAGIERELMVDDTFVHRYRTDSAHDGLTGGEATFLMCAFWLVDARAMTGRADEAEALFDRLLACGNDLGLFAEEYDPATGELLGNFPQAFTHLALISSAHRLTTPATPVTHVEQAEER